MSTQPIKLTAAEFAAPWLEPRRRPSLRRAVPGARLGAMLGAICLGGLLIAQGIAITQSYLWAAPLLCLLTVALAAEIPVVALLTGTMVVRVLLDGSFASDSRHTGALNPLGGIALLFVLLAAGLLIRRRQAVGPFLAMAGWLCVWTTVAILSHGASTVTIREGVREISIVALAAIVCNAPRGVSVSSATRIVALAGLAPALLALYQALTHTGMLVAGQIRSNGTFTHPNGAAMLFAIACAACLWRWLEEGRRRTDMMLAALFAAATISTFSLSGLGSLVVMIVSLGALRPGALRLKIASCVAAALVLVAFLATPLGAERVANESSTQIASAQTRGTANTSLAWRLYKWGTLLPEWRRSPVLGQGLGATSTAQATSEDVTAGKVPHNEYLRYLVETGALGLALGLGGVVALARGLLRRRGRPGAAGAGTLGLAILGGCLVNAVADNTLLYSTTGYAAALIVAAVMCTGRVEGQAG